MATKFSGSLIISRRKTDAAMNEMGPGLKPNAGVGGVRPWYPSEPWYLGRVKL